MWILLPPSEGKDVPARGRPLDLDQLSFPDLTAARRQVTTALVDLCRGDAERARTALGLPAGLAGQVDLNAGLLAAPTAPAGRIYAGVLYDALGLTSMTAAARRRATSRLLVTSALFGLLRIGDRIPAYRLSGAVTLPTLGTVASVWRGALDPTLRQAAERRLVVDLRSGTYAGFWRPSGDTARRVVRVRVLQEQSGRRTVVSHFNKATKGRITRDLLEEGSDPRTPAALAGLLRSLGWHVEPTPRDGGSLDVIVAGT